MVNACQDKVVEPNGTDTAANESQRAHQFKISKEDPLGNEYVYATMLDNTERLGWSTTHFSDDYMFNDYIEEFMPQARDRRLYLQDLFARYVPKMGDPYQLGLDRKSLEEIGEYLYNNVDGKYAEFNNEFVKRCLEQKRNTYYKLVDKILEMDINGDESKESVMVNKVPSQMVLDADLEEEIQFNTFSIIVNGISKLTFEYEDAEIYYLNLDICSIMVVQPLGYNIHYSGEYAYTYNHKAQVYQYMNEKFEYLGRIDGNIDLVVGEGRFTTLGHADTSPHSDGPIHEMVREYLIRDEKLYQILHSWQSARTIWQLKKELPIYKDQYTTVPYRTIPAGSFVMFVFYSPDGWLKLVSDQNINGYIKMSLDEKGYWDAYPYAMPGGEAMESYFVEYGGVAG